ncbi:MAG: serine hydrolase domain-containing protein [Clostridia bacterium]
MAIGIGAGRNPALNETVADIFPDLITLLAPKNVKSITIQHLLTMSSGSKFNELNSLLEDDWLKGYLETDTSFEPGSRFEYNSLNTYVLGAILRQKTGQSLCEYLKPRLFDPLGIDPVALGTMSHGTGKRGMGIGCCCRRIWRS